MALSPERANIKDRSLSPAPRGSLVKCETTKRGNKSRQAVVRPAPSFSIEMHSARQKKKNQYKTQFQYHMI